MKEIFTSFPILLCLFFGLSFVEAQDSKEILDLKIKLTKIYDDKGKSDVYRSLSHAYQKEKKIDSAIVYAKKLSPYYLKIGDKSKSGNLELHLVSLYNSFNNDDAVVEHFKNAEKYYDDLALDKKVYLNNVGGYLYYSIFKNYTKSINYYERNIDFHNQGKKIDKEKMIQSYQALMSLYYSKNYDYANTFRITNDYLKYVKEESPETLGDVHAYLGSFYWGVGFHKKSIDELEKAIEVYQKQTGKEKNIYSATIFLGNNYMQMNDLDKAKKYTRDAYEYFKKTNDSQLLSNIYNSFSHIAYQEKKFSDSKDYILKAINIIPDSDEGNLYNKAYLGTVKYRILMESDSSNIKTNPEKYKELQVITKELSDNFEKIEAKKDNLTSGLLLHNYGLLADAYGMLGNYDKAYYYLDKAVKQKEKSYSVEKIKALSDVQGEQELNYERSRIKLEEETKRIQLEKEIELKALRFEYEKKQAAAKTEVERQRLLLEEEHKRREISIKYDEEQKAVALKYAQEKKVAKAEQEKKDAEAKAELSKSKNIRNMSIGGAATALLLLGFAGWSYNQKRKDGIKIAAEKKKSEDLLLNILPQEVAQELKEKGKSDAKYYDEVSVLFTDFVNFTATSEKIGVQELLEELNVCFTEFDNIMGRHGLEKIKTIGDAYLAVSGLPTVNKDHAKNAIAASQEILKFIEERKKVSPNALDLRIGIHSGHVIAGIVGVKKFAYDIWGDTVNTAARMEQAGEKGKINISKNTYELVKDDFATTYRGKISVKGKGEQEMYFVEA